MGTIEVIARHRGARRLRPHCKALLRRLLRTMGRGRSGVTLLLAPDAEVRRLNRRYRTVDRATDVLAFPSGGDLEPGRPHLGEIAIALPRAARQAKRAGWPLRSEISLLVVHGFLHLLGYDHETDDGTMRRVERRMVRRLAGLRLEERRLAWGGPGASGAGPPHRPRRS